MLSLTVHDDCGVYFFLGWIARSAESAEWMVSDAVKQRKAPYAFPTYAAVWA